MRSCFRHPSKMSDSLDIKRLQATGSIIDVANALGMKIKKSGSGVWSLMEEGSNDETSLRLFEKTNTFKRFSEKTSGGCSKGDIVNLVRHVQDCDFKQAVEWLTSYYPDYVE